MNNRKKTIFFIRHCHDEPSENLNQVEAAEVALTPYGIRQAEALGSFLRSREIDAIYSSVYKRAKETSAIIAEQIQGRLFFDERLNEQALARDRLDKKVAKDIKRRMLSEPEYVPDGAQSLRESIDKFLAALNEILESPYSRICIVSHGFLMEAALRKRLGPIFTHKLSEGSITVVSFCNGDIQIEMANHRPFLLLRTQRRIFEIVKKLLSAFHLLR